MAADTRFEVVTDDVVVGDRLLLGFSLPGMAGLTAIDYLVKQHTLEQCGHVRASGFPAVAPFSGDEPRHPIRLYTDGETAALISELFVPVWAAEAFVDGLLSWADEAGIAEIALPHGIQYPHEPDSHQVFVTATPAYRDRRLSDTDLGRLAGGILDGVAGELVLRGLEPDGVPVGAFITPSHPPGPDLEAALLLLDAIERVYGIDVDESALEQQAADRRQYYAEMADRMQSLDGKSGQEYPEDRMFM